MPRPDRRARRIVRLILAALLLLFGLWVARGFLLALAWTVVIAIAVWPLYTRCAALLPQHGRAAALAPLLFTLLTAIALLVPLAFIANEVAREAQTAMQWIANVQQSGVAEPGWLSRVPVIGERAATWWRTHLSDPEAARRLFSRIGQESWADWTRIFGMQVLRRLLLAFVTFVALYALLRHGARVGEHLLALADRFLGDPGEELAAKMVEAVRGTVNGTVLVALGEAALITVGYVVVGVPNPVLFGVVTAAFALVPLGAWVAFGAASIVLLVVGGGALMAAGLFGYGAVVMLVGDNFVQPAVIGGAARLPFLWALVGILGGLESFGVLGLFVGPVIMAALMTIWREWIAPRAHGEAG